MGLALKPSAYTHTFEKCLDVDRDEEVIGAITQDVWWR